MEHAGKTWRRRRGFLEQLPASGLADYDGQTRRLNPGSAIRPFHHMFESWLLPAIDRSMNPTLIGSIGVTILLAAFALNLLRVVSTNSPVYLVMNLAGSVLAGISSYQIGFIPFVVLEGAWALVAGIALLRGFLTKAT
jgi:hypothetical protein